MLLYWLLFLGSVYWSVSRLRPIPQAAPRVQHDRWPNVWRGFYVFLVLIIGLRHEVGVDWFNLIKGLEGWAQRPIYDIFASDFSYSLLEWIGFNIAGGIYFVNTICAVLFTWGLFSFCRVQPRPSLALVAAVPFLVIVVAMNSTRQAVAIGLIMQGLATLRLGGGLRLLFYLVLAATFHTSAVLLMPLGILIAFQRHIFILLWAGPLLFFMALWLVDDRFEDVAGYYLHIRMESAGAYIRTLMNVVPATLFLVFRKRFQLTPEQCTCWTWMAWGSLLLLVLFYVVPSSSLVDRVGWYFIPLQIFVLSSLPNVLGRKYGNNVLWVLGVVVYSAAIMFVWLFFSRHSHYWLPYQFYPWVWLWQ